MHVIGFCGYSGSGKTTLIEQLIARLCLAGQRVSVVKHAHHNFDIDHEGKDSWRHRQAGAFEVVIASNRRLAKIREYPALEEPTYEQLVGGRLLGDRILADLRETTVRRDHDLERAGLSVPPRVLAFVVDVEVVVRVLDDRDALAGQTKAGDELLDQRRLARPRVAAETDHMHRPSV